MSWSYITLHCLQKPQTIYYTSIALMLGGFNLKNSLGFAGVNRGVGVFFGGFFVYRRKELFELWPF